MRLSIFNGSPRGARSSTKILLDHVVAGFMEISGNSVEVFYLTEMKTSPQRLIEAFNNAENILIAYPLYIDSMPACTLRFIEALEPYRDIERERNLGFLMQYGFPESTHARAIKRFNEKLARRLHCRYLGTLSRGYCNRMERKSPKEAASILEQLHELGRQLGATGNFDPSCIEKLSGLEILPAKIQLLINLFSSLPTSKSFLVRQLWVHHTFGRRNAMPYLE